MAVAPIFPVLLLAVISRCKCDSTIGYHNNGNSATQIGDLLKPPPPPLSNILPVPFHKGPGRSQRQNIDGYHYQPPPPPPPPSQTSNDFKFPSPFYKQYNFNFVPPPQPFTTPPSSLFQKVSGWLFPSQETSYETGPYPAAAPLKKDCNSCNLVPWIPVIRYNLGKSNSQINSLPTYGPPSPTAFASQSPNTQFYPQSFNSQSQEHFSTGVPHAVYGPPKLTQPNNFNNIPSSTYGPPSQTHTLSTASQSPPTSTFSVHSSSFSIPSSSYGVPSSSVGQLSSTYGVPSASYGVPSSTYGVPSSSYNAPSSIYGLPSTSYGVPSSTFKSPSSSYATPSPLYGSPTPLSTSIGSESSHISGIINNELHLQNDFDNTDIKSSGDLHLPHVGSPTAFRNSYGEIIGSLYDPTGFPASAAEASKIKTEIVALNSTKLPLPNASLALANPAPFSLKGGRNIHTLQPVALPNLSVSPLPPIFNARPFRPLKTMNLLTGDIFKKQPTKNNDIKQSVPVAVTHSIDYPSTVIQSHSININDARGQNQTKAYRNILNSYVIDNIRDISSQASEDHESAAKNNQDASFESTGADAGNDLYDSNIPTGYSQIPSNHKPNFADLRGVKDADVDKYRTENNLQHIDSPLLYLKPSAPHKGFGNFVIAVSTPVNDNDYEIYDESQSTPAPPVSTLTSWDESRNDYGEVLSPPPKAQEELTKTKIVQIIVPYTTGKQSAQNNVNFEHIPQDWSSNSEDEYTARKAPTNTENPYFSTYSDIYTTPSTPTEEYLSTVTEQYESERLNTPAILNDLYDVKEPPFDIIKLQHTIDGWTEQEYSLRYKTPRNSGKYAKQIPDEYFTTADPISNYVTTNNYIYDDFYDHEGASSMHHAITDQKNKTSKPKKEYNAIERFKNHYQSGKNEDLEDKEKLHIYTAASSFRSSTTTQAPWEAIQTSISPLTKEKIYVVTSKPWREIINATKDWYEADNFESKKTESDNDVSASDNLPFKSPRFSNRPSLSDGKIDSVKGDSSYGFSRTWYQRINDLERRKERNTTSLPEGDQQQYYLEEDSTITTTTAGPLDEQYEEERK